MHSSKNLLLFIKLFKINHKFPKLFFEDEDSILNIIRKKLSRGKIIININYQILNENINKINLDEIKLSQYLKIIKNLSKRKDIDGKITINNILSFPDIIIKRYFCISFSTFNNRI